MAPAIRILLTVILLSWSFEVNAVDRFEPSTRQDLATSSVWAEKYRVEFKGALKRRIKHDLRDISVTYALQDRPAPSHKNLQERARRDLDRFAAYFRNTGHFAPRLEAQTIADPGRARVVFRIDPGFVYTIGDIRVEPDPAEAALPDADQISLKSSQVAEARRIAAAAKKLAEWYQDSGHAFAKAGRVRLGVTHADRTVDVVLPITVGPSAHFGEISISGLTRTRSDVVYRKLTIREGELFSRTELERSRDRLRGTGLFSAIRLEPSPMLDPLGRIPLKLSITERRFRTVKLGVNYLTDLGFGGRAGFEHRNLRGRGDTLEIALPVSEIGIALESSYRIPDFRKDEQVLEFRAKVGMENTDAYEVNRFTLGSGIARRLSKSLRLGSGVDYSFEEVTQQGEETRFQLFAFPQEFSRNTSDSPLAPSRGSWINVEAVPYVNIREVSDAFLKTSVGVRAYVPLMRRPQVILATRLRLGAITGTSRDNILASVRYYAGGGGSIRGFEYQTVGPLVDRKPVGGRSLLESSVELRIQATSRIGLVAFVDAGTAAEDWRPGRGETIRVGAGGGGRYRTPIGPVRFDVAAPVNRRDIIDDGVEFYISIGHSF